MRRLWFFTVLAAIILLAATPYASPFSRLHVVHGSNGNGLAEWPLSAGERWGIHFTHSWYRVAQEEIYRVDRRGRMVLHEVKFASYPAAMYYDENPPQGLIREDGWLKIKDIERPVAFVRFKVGYTTDCYLMVKDRRIYFKSLAAEGESLVFAVDRVSPLEFFYAAVSLSLTGDLTGKTL